MANFMLFWVFLSQMAAHNQAAICHIPLGIHWLIYACAPSKVCFDAEAEPESDVSGIPDFWMHVLQSHKGWNEEVSLLPPALIGPHHTLPLPAPVWPCNGPALHICSALPLSPAQSCFLSCSCCLQSQLCMLKLLVCLHPRSWHSLYTEACLVIWLLLSTLMPACQC